MDTVIKILKAVSLLVLIAVGVAIIYAIYIFIDFYKYGDPEGFLKENVVQTIIEEKELTPHQVELLESGKTEELINDLQNNKLISPK